MRVDNINNSLLVNQTQKLSDIIDAPLPNIPAYHILRMETEIKIKSDKTYGQVTENVQYVLKNGLFTSIIRKISLAGSSDSIIAFKVSSKYNLFYVYIYIFYVNKFLICNKAI